MEFTEKLKESFKSGLVMILPFLVTILIIKFMADYVFLFINPLVKTTQLTKYTRNIEIVAQIIAVIVVMVFITCMGYISNYKASERLSRKIEKYVEEVPLFGSVYSTFDSISNSLSGEGSKFEEVVLVEFPWEDRYTIGLVTSEAPERANEAAGKENMKSIFVPLSPNPTMGHLMMAEEEDYEKLDMSIQEGIKLVLTTGIAYDEGEIPDKIKEVTE